MITMTDETRAKYCDTFRRLDEEYDTPRNSPLHHDNRCVCALNLTDQPLIDRVQRTAGLLPGERAVAGPAVADARLALRHGLSVTRLSPYSLVVEDSDGDELTADYSTTSNSVLRASVRIGSTVRPITRRNGESLRDRVQAYLTA